MLAQENINTLQKNIMQLVYKDLSSYFVKHQIILKVSLLFQYLTSKNISDILLSFTVCYIQSST